MSPVVAPATEHSFSPAHSRSSVNGIRDMSAHVLLATLAALFVGTALSQNPACRRLFRCGRKPNPAPPVLSSAAYSVSELFSTAAESLDAELESSGTPVVTPAPADAASGLLSPVVVHDEVCSCHRLLVR